MTALGRNVTYDPASDHRWDELNQAPFLDAVFEHLRTELGGAFDEHAFYILSAHDPAVRPQSMHADGERKVLIWISNETGAALGAMSTSYHAVFKSHLAEAAESANVFAFNIGCVGKAPLGEPKPLGERTISVFFSGQLTIDRRPLYCALHPVYGRLPPSVFERALGLRRRGFGRFVPDDVSRAIPGSVLRFTAFFMEGLPRDEYLRLLGDCRIALCPPGAHDAETFRHMEAMRAGAVIVSQALPATHFYRGAPIVIVDDWRSGVARCRELLADEDMLNDLHAAALRWWADVCCERATARYVADRLRAITSTA